MTLNRSIEDGYHGELAADLWNQFDYVPEENGSGDVTPAQGSVDSLAGTYIRNKLVLSSDNAAHFLNRGQLASQYTTLDPADPLKNYEANSGAAWFGHKGQVNGRYDAATKSGAAVLDTLTFGFYETRADIDPAYNGFAGNAPGVRRLDGFSAMTEAQRVATRQAIQTWDELIALDFVETKAADADLNFMNTTTGPAQASAYLPYNYGPQYRGIVGDVAVNPNQASNHQFDEGEYGLTTLIHEIGHSMGLEHPGRYNFSANFTATYANGAEYYQDSNQYSIMSYWRAQETGANHVDWVTTVLKYGSTPGVHDVAAIQRIYGADMTTRTGNDVYGFNNTTGLDTFDFAATPHPVVTIWDAGGNDTLDLSGYNTPSVIDLNPGAFSSAGGTVMSSIPSFAEVNAARLAAGLTARTEASYKAFVDTYGVAFKNGLMTDNIAIAYGAIVENAVGGGGNDRIVANSVANVIDGRGGNDTVSYHRSDAGVTVNLADGLAEKGGYAEGDTLIGIENVDGSAFADSLTGNALANILNGEGGDDFIDGGAGNDVLNGGDGNDELIGGSGDDILNGGLGNDRLVGGGGTDMYVFSDLFGNDVINGFQKGEKVDISELHNFGRMIKGGMTFDFNEDGVVDLTITVNGGSFGRGDLII